MNVGIEALNVYGGLAQIPVPALFAGRGLDPGRLENLMMDNRSVGLPFEDPVTHAVNAALPLVERLSAQERDRIEVLVTSTESGLDHSKSVASYVHRYLGLSRHCRVVEAKQACYAATAAVQLAAGYLAAQGSGAKALVVATDVALVDENASFTEPAMGTGAAAVLLGDDPRVLRLDQGAFGLYSYEVLDSARPGPTFDIADADRSLFAYLDCLTGSVGHYLERVEGADFVATFDYLAMHTPFAGMVRAAHRKTFRELTKLGAAAVAEDFERRVAPALVYPRQVGNLCSGSVYLALASLIDRVAPTGEARVGLFSYGSGCAAEFFSGVIGPSSAVELAAMGIGEHLAARVELGFEEYAELLAAGRECLVPHRDREIDVDSHLGVARRYGGRPRPLLIWSGTKDYHRGYEWISAGTPPA